jgi:FdhD protein
MNVKTIAITKHFKGESCPVIDSVAQEEPLEIRIEGRSVAVIMRSPDIEQDIELVIGFLCTEGVIEDYSDIQAIAHLVDPSNPQYNAIDIILASGVPAKQRHRADRTFFASSSCGICGKATQDRILQHFPPITTQINVSIDILCSLPEKLRKQQAIFQQTGGLHAAALFQSDGELLVLREDIGRHNAVDKIVGWALKEDLDCSDLILFVSGRVAFEIAQKTLGAQIPVLAAIGAPSSMAVEFCQEAGIQLFGFVQRERCNEYYQRKVFPTAIPRS